MSQQVLEQQIETILSFDASAIRIERDQVNCPIFWIERTHAVDFLKFLKNDNRLQFDFLSDLTAYDEMGSSEEKLGRFVMVYQLFSPQYKTRVRIKVRLHEQESIASVASIWSAANWAEREVFDMFGIHFDGHPDLRRILMDVRWEGYPLRKDYPLRKYQLFNEPEPMPVEVLEKK